MPTDQQASGFGSTIKGSTAMARLNPGEARYVSPKIPTWFRRAKAQSEL